MQIPRLYLRPTETETTGLGCICVLARPPGDSNTLYSLRAIVKDYGYEKDWGTEGKKNGG